METRTLCLGILSLGDATGYEIKKQFEEGPFSHFYRVGFGSIYPALNEISARGLATVTQHAQENRPDKKVYSLTELGRRALMQALLKRPERDQVRSDFLFTMAFCSLLPPAFAAGLVAERLTFYRDHIAHLRHCLATEAVSPGRQFVRGFGLAVYEAAARYLEENKHMVVQDVAQDARSAAQ
jgi:DNA-binding PadR family transcriptional regulator